jgi:uncharacterized protein YceH (UPF0502 family)
MDWQLDELQARVLGCLIEKEHTTPDYYPLSLNGLTTACNQKTGRFPVMDVSEAEVEATLAELQHLDLVMEKGSTARARKFAHKLPRHIELDEQQLALICVLLLRGFQTAGELRQRTERLASFESVEETEMVLDDLAKRGDEDGGAITIKLPRQPGKTQCRYAHLLSGEIDTAAMEQAEQASVAGGPIKSALAERVEALEARVAKLEALLEQTDA